MTTTKCRLRHLSFAAVAAAISCATASTAAAQVGTASTNRLELSSDGRNYAPSLSEPLFSDPPLLVPGESIADRLWVRNASSEPALVSLYVVDTDSSLPSTVSSSDDFQFRGETEDSQVTTEAVSALDPCTPVAQAALEPGEDASIALEVALPITSDNVSQRESLALDLVVDLRAQTGGGSRCGASTDSTPDQGEVGGSGPSDGGGPGFDGRMWNPSDARPPLETQPNGQLPRTGSEVESLLILAVVAVLIGAGLRRAGRASREVTPADAAATA